MRAHLGQDPPQEEMDALLRVVVAHLGSKTLLAPSWRDEICIFLRPGPWTLPPPLNLRVPGPLGPLKTKVAIRKLVIRAGCFQMGDRSPVQDNISWSVGSGSYLNLKEQGRGVGRCPPRSRPRTRRSG